MSINAAGTSDINKLNYVCDLDGARKKELERRRKLRLLQVREQSKEVATQIRDRVAREKHRQIRNIEEIKSKELLLWKKKHVNSTLDDYYNCLSNLGDAHVAADRENVLAQHITEQQRKNREIAVMRGRQAMQKEKLKNIKKSDHAIKRSSSQLKMKIDKQTSVKDAPHLSSHVQPIEPLEDDEQRNQFDESDEESIDMGPESLTRSLSRSKTLPKAATKTKFDRALPVVRFTQISDLIEKRKETKNLCEEILESDSLRTQFAPTSRSKSPKQAVTLTMKSQHFPSAPNSPKQVTAHSPKSPGKVLAPATKSPTPVRKSILRPTLPSQTGKITPKTHKFSSPTLFRRNAVTSKVNRTPVKVISSRVAAARSVKANIPQRREFVPRFTKEPIAKAGILKKKSDTVITTTSTEPIENVSKVQFYDHFNRYGSEYDPAPDIVQREIDPPTLTATEAARVQNEMDVIRLRQLEELRQKSEQRSKESLDKNQIRKDYELLTQQLDVLSKEENNLRTFAMPNEQFSEERIRQMVVNRQQNLNRAFEEIQHKPVVITCPPIISNQNGSSSDFNVATSLSPREEQRRISPLDSSDSCTSILLGYVDNRSRRLVKDIKECKDANDHSKRAELLKLLTRLDHLRELLKEEIKRNASQVTSPNLETFYRSVLELDTRKKEILADRDANKENGDANNQSDELQKRESILKSKEDLLEKKMKELFLKKHWKKPDAKHTHDHSSESWTSESTTSSVDEQLEPVKILIEVKNAKSTIRKTRSPKKVRISSEHVNVQVHAPKYQDKPSVEGSSSSTTYRSPPTSFQTDLTKVLSKQAAINQPKTKPMKKSVSTKPQTVARKASPESPALVHYITRLLGMSRPSIDQLGVSSSTSIETPTDSVMLVPGNMSQPRVAIDENHLNKMEQEIDKLRRFAKEVDDSLSQSNSNESEVENVWMKMFNKKEQEAKVVKKRKKSKEMIQKKQEDGLREVGVEMIYSKLLNKKDKAMQTNGIQPPQAVSTVQPDIPEKSKRLIDDLTKQIEQVRQDKQKLLEKTMSSVPSSSSSSGKGLDSTEYRDFKIPTTQSHRTVEENNVSSQASDVISLPGHFVEEVPKNLMNSKQIGISFSRDSGFGSSRPVTSTDFRVSPEMKLAEKQSIPAHVSTELTSNTLSKPNDPSNGVIDTNTKSTQALGGSGRKSGKPPISLKRFSPQLDTEQLQPHDLSTINEIDTSVTSRINPSTRNDSSESSVPAAYNRFPTFFEYAKLQQHVTADESASDEEKRYSEAELKKMLEMSSVTVSGLNYRKLDQPQSDDKMGTEKSSKIDEEYIDVELEMMKRNLLATSDLSGSSSSDKLAKDFNQIGLNWASVMLKKTSTAQNLESSSSSFKSSSTIPNRNQPLNNISNDDNPPCNQINGNLLNIREFLTRELLKKTHSNSSSSTSDNSTLTNQFLQSLLSNSSNSTPLQHATHRTSTPNHPATMVSEPIDDDDGRQSAKEEANLFSGESYLSSVRGTSHSETSGTRETSETKDTSK